MHHVDASSSLLSSSQCSQEKDRLRQSNLKCLWRLRRSLCSLLFGLFLTFYKICHKKRFHHDGYHRLRILYICPPSLLLSPQVIRIVRNNSWSRPHSHVFRKIACDYSSDYICLRPSNRSLRVQRQYILASDTSNRTLFTIKMSLIISYVIGTFFMDVFAVASDTILLCYCLEMDIYRGMTYACPPSLKSTLEVVRG